MDWNCTKSGTNNDRWLIEHVFPGKTDGFYLELGMGHPILESATYNLELLGWSGVSYEPNPDLLGGFSQRRNPVVPMAVWTHTGLVHFTRPKNDPYRAGVASVRFPHQKERDAARGADLESVPCIAFMDVLKHADRFCAGAKAGYIDAICIDIEGAEVEILKTFVPHSYLVGAWTIESADPGSLIPLMASYGYRRVTNPFNTTAAYEYYFLPDWSTE
jgi:hypothetical protein